MITQHEINTRGFTFKKVIKQHEFDLLDDIHKCRYRIVPDYFSVYVCRRHNITNEEKLYELRQLEMDELWMLIDYLNNQIKNLTDIIFGDYPLT